VVNSPRHRAITRARAAFVRACEIDVAVRKPGNVSDASPGHGMHAALFRASASAAAAPLFAPGARVGERIEAAMAATWAVAGCNTNLGILLLCAPLALAVEREPGPHTPTTLRLAVAAVLATLDLADTQAVYRAIAQANPGGLGSAPEQDVHCAPSVGLREAMALAADRDRIARQYRDAFADLFDIGLPAYFTALENADPATRGASAAPVQRLYLTLLGAFPDSHIVRKQGPQMAQTVMQTAQAWLARLATQGHRAQPLDTDPAWGAWDQALKDTGINPGTTADLTVATLMLAGLLHDLVPG
jgi:triphosphoribosyl-dephospho-CoA synthase